MRESFREILDQRIAYYGALKDGHEKLRNEAMEQDDLTLVVHNQSFVKTYTHVRAELQQIKKELGL